MNKIRIDGSIIDSREALFSSIRSQVGEALLPGSNLDALHDYLTSVTVHTVIEIRCESLLKETLGDYWTRTLWLLSDCLEENRDLKLEYTE